MYLMMTHISLLPWRRPITVRNDAPIDMAELMVKLLIEVRKDEPLVRWLLEVSFSAVHHCCSLVLEVLGQTK